MTATLRRYWQAFWASDWPAGVSLLLIAGLYAWLIDAQVAGFTRDDGVYITTAKALAQGEGPRLIHSALQPPEVKYPLLLPLLLAPVWWWLPQFPDNLFWLSLIPVLCGVAGYGLAYRYLVDAHQAPRWLAVTIIWLVALNFYGVYFITSVMAEGPYLLLSMLTLWLADRRLSRLDPHRPAPVIHSLWPVVLASVLAFHTRTFGLSLIAAIGLWLFLRGQRRLAVVYAATTLALTVLPWGLWTQTQFRMTDLTFPTLLAYAPYAYELARNVSVLAYGDRLLDTFGSLIYRLLEAMFTLIPNFFKVISAWHTRWEENVVANWIFLGVTTLGSYGLALYFLVQLVSLLRRLLRHPRQAAYSLTLLYMLCYLALAVFWSYEDQMARFLLMILPLIWWYFFKPLLSPDRSWKRPLVVCLLIFALIPAGKTVNSIAYIRRHHWVDMNGTPLWRDYQAAFAFVRGNLPGEAVLASNNDLVFYLYTGRQGFHLNNSSVLRWVSQISDTRFLSHYLDSFDALRVGYLVVEPGMRQRVIVQPEHELSRLLYGQYPERFRLVFVSPGRYLKIYRYQPATPQGR